MTIKLSRTIAAKVLKTVDAAADLKSRYLELDAEHERSKVALGIAQNDFYVAGDKCNLIWQKIVRIISEKSAIAKQLNEL